MGQIIEVTVSPSGEVAIETKGFAGPACREATQAIEAALGRRLAEELTAEYHRGKVAAGPVRQPRQQVGRR